jgi:transcriptional regulator with GAF, ATPase, and Fis domain
MICVSEDDRNTLPLDRRVLSLDTIAIEVVSGPDAGKTFCSSADEMSVGTAPTNDVVLTDETVSRYHLELERSEGEILLRDHGSTNGTIVNGIRLELGAIPPGSKIRMGRTVIVVREGERREIELHDSARLGRLVGASDIMRKLMAMIARIAKSDASVLICGETGTGKELVARELHDRSPRRGQPFEVIDCGAILPTLLASELFGHEQGAFTGAERQHLGAFERADGGTLFLDEIGELPPALQTALLGALERRQFHRVGGRDPVHVDVRVLAATNRDLRREVNSGAFRQDLYYRIAVVPLTLPPLRDRPEDIPILVEHFLRLLGRESTEGFLTPKVLDSFRQHFWPGNVRELKNTIEAAIATDEVPNLFSPIGEREQERDEYGAANAILLDELVGRRYDDARAELIDRFEVAYITALLERNDGNVSQAARDSGMHRSYLTKLLRRHQLRLKRFTVKRED